MKIYNKKGFFSGLFWITTAILTLIMTSFKGMNIRDWLLVVIGLVLGFYYLCRSFSKNASMEDQDEMTQHVLHKSRALAFFWTKVVTIGLFVFYAMLASHTKHEIHITLMIAFAIMLIGQIIIEGITEHYCTVKVE
jgi:uncharacterized membrane protein